MVYFRIMCWNISDDLFIMLTYLFGFLITYYMTYKYTYELYIKSRSRNKYNYLEWLDYSEWEGVFIFLIVAWPIALILLLIRKLYFTIKFIIKAIKELI